MLADEHQIEAAAAQPGEVALQDNSAKGMDQLQSIGVDEHLVHIPCARFQRVDQLMGRRPVKVAVEIEMDTVFAFQLDDLEIHGHRLPSFHLSDGV